MITGTIQEVWIHHMRWIRLRGQQICRVLITGKQGTAGSLFSILSVIVSLIIYFISRNNVSLTFLVILGCLVFLLSTVAGGYWALKVMPPEHYAQVSIAGRTASETLQLIAFDIQCACRGFLKYSRRCISKEGSEASGQQNSLDKLKKRCARDSAALLKISALLELASKELEIPLPALKSLFFEYDPAIHRTRAQKFIQARELLISGYVLDAKHKMNLEDEAFGILQKAEDRVRIQERIFKHRAIFPFLHRMAAVRSTSEATKEYARAMSFVAELTLQRVRSSKNWDSRQRIRLNDFVNALTFLARKQRVHSGFDLNQSCLSLTRSERNVLLAPLADQPELLQTRETALEELGRSLDRGDTGIFQLPFTDPTKVTPDTCKRALDLVRSLAGMWKHTVRKIDSDRRQLTASFSSFYSGWRDSSGASKTLLITHGFSTTVREMFKFGLPPATPGLALPSIFVMKSSDADDLDARLMVSALLEVPKHERRFLGVAAGDKDAVAGFIDQHTKVMVVLGAECFDGYGRCVHPWGLKHVGLIRKKLGGSGGPCVVVVAEGYKFHDDLLSIADFFRFHLDRIRLYEPKLIDVIISTDVHSAHYDRRGLMANRSPQVHGKKPRSPVDRRGQQHPRDEHILRRPIFFDPTSQSLRVREGFDLLIDEPNSTSASGTP